MKNKHLYTPFVPILGFMSKSFVTPASPFKVEVIDPLFPWYLRGTKPGTLHICHAPFVFAFLAVEAEKSARKRFPVEYWGLQFALGYPE